MVDVEDLITKIAIDERGAGNRTPLMRAIGAGHCEVAAFLISKGADIELTDKAGRVALHWGCVGGQVNAVKMLLENNCVLNVQSLTGTTPLHGAAAAGKLECVKLLFGWSAEKCKPNEGATQDPLTHTLENGDGATAEALAKKGNHAAIVAICKAGKLVDENESGACVIS